MFFKFVVYVLCYGYKLYWEYGLDFMWIDVRFLKRFSIFFYIRKNGCFFFVKYL